MSKVKTIIFDLGGVYFTNGTRKAIDIISDKWNLNNDKVEEVFKGKLGKEYRIGKISHNVQDRVDYLESKYSFLKYFDAGVFSHIVGVRKPNSDIYKLVLEQFISPEDTRNKLRELGVNI